MGAAVRQEITKTLTSLMSHAEDAIRTGTAAALGAIVGSLPAEEKTDVILSHMLGTYILLLYYGIIFYILFALLLYNGCYSVLSLSCR